MKSQTPFVYLPLYQVYKETTIINARVLGDPLAFGKTVEKTVHDLNANLLVFDVTTLEQRAQFSSFPQRVAGTFVGAFGLLALVLAAVGIYGVTAYTARQRTREVGIRMALGATQQDVLRLVLSHGLRLMLAGVGLGLALSFVTDSLSKELAPWCNKYRCVDVCECGDLALRCGLVRLLHTRSSRHARGPHGGAALPMKAVVIQLP